MMRMRWILWILSIVWSLAGVFPSQAHFGMSCGSLHGRLTEISSPRKTGTGTINGLGVTARNHDVNDRLDNDTNPNNGSTWHDAAGNTTSLSGTWQYDYANRLTNYTSGSVVVTLVYDDAGNRVRRIQGSDVVQYVVAELNPTGWSQVLEERNGTGGLLRSYQYGERIISQRTGGGTTRFYGHDALGSVRFLTDATTTATVTDWYVFDAWGRQVAGSGTTVNPYRYKAEAWDGTLGMYYQRARWMRPVEGRFWTMDPFEGYPTDPISLHKYLYASASPINRIDPGGHESLPSLMTGFTIKAIGFRMLVGSAVGVWDANFRGYSQWEGLAYGAVGGAIGPIIPWQLGVTLTGYGIGEALMDGDYDSALFRGATAVVGVGSMRWAKSLPGGRLGNLNTQLQNSKLALYLQSKGWKIRNGGGQGGEERIPPPGGGRNGETWVDITVEKNGRILRVQTVDTLANGAPTPRELSAASRIRAAFPEDKLLLVPKADAGGAGSTTPPLFRGPEDDE